MNLCTNCEDAPKTTFIVQSQITKRYYYWCISQYSEYAKGWTTVKSEVHSRYKKDVSPHPSIQTWYAPPPKKPYRTLTEIP